MKKKGGGQVTVDSEVLILDNLEKNITITVLCSPVNISVIQSFIVFEKECAKQKRREICSLKGGEVKELLLSMRGAQVSHPL